VLEAGVHRTGVNEIGPSELPDSTQALKSWLLDDFSLPIVNLDETMDRAANFVFAMRILRQCSTPSPYLSYH
jgi:hypothetical protein